MASTTSFSDNLRLVLELLSMSAARLASELAVDKSVVSRWLNGSVQPSAHNLSRLSAFVASRLPAGAQQRGSSNRENDPHMRMSCKSTRAC
jgi:transcriptional regulator with XRE-family HTH domain